MNRRPTEPKAKTTGFFSKNPLRAKLEAAARDAESRPAREPSQADLDRAARRQGVESRAAEAAMRERRANPTEGERKAMSARIPTNREREAMLRERSATPTNREREVMLRERQVRSAFGTNPTEREREALRSGTDGFKDTTRMRYMQGGDVAGYAKGGSVKGAAKISKVMGEFKRGELHSGSKKGPEVTSKKQATAIALSEARKAGAKIPQPVQKKSLGGALKALSPAAMLADSKVGKDLMGAGVFGVGGLLLNQLMKKKQSGQPLTPAENQKLAQAQQEQTAMKKGGSVAKKAMGGAMTAMSPAAMPGHSDVGSDLMKKGGPVKKAMGGAMNARKQALAARASAASNEARNAQMARRPVAPKRGPAGAGFAAKPMVGKSMPPMGPMVSKSPSADNTVVTERMVQAQPTSMPAGVNMKRGGLTAMPKGKKC